MPLRHEDDDLERDLEDGVEGHFARRAADEDDAEGHIARRAADEDDAEGHLARSRVADADDDDDVEGHLQVRSQG